MEKLGVADYGLLVYYGGHYDYHEKIDNIRALGYDGIEKLYPKSAEDALFKVSTLKKKGMDFATCNCDDIELAIRWTAALGGKYIWANVYRKDFDNYIRQVNELTKAANKFGVEVAVHNHMGQTIETQEQVEKMLELCPDTKLLFDVGHLTVAGGDAKYIADTYYDRIVAYHFKGWQTSATPDAEDWRQRGHFCGLAQGDTHVDNEYVYKNAVKKGFDGWMFIEQDTHLRDPLVDLKESYDVLKKWRSEV